MATKVEGKEACGYIRLVSMRGCVERYQDLLESISRRKESW